MNKLLKVTAFAIFLFAQCSISYAEKITIFGGTGAVGGYFSMQLAEPGHEVSVLGRPKSRHLAQIQTQGLAVQTSESDYCIKNQLENR